MPSDSEGAKLQTVAREVYMACGEKMPDGKPCDTCHAVSSAMASFGAIVQAAESNPVVEDRDFYKQLAADTLGSILTCAYHAGILTEAGPPQHSPGPRRPVNRSRANGRIRH